VGVFSALSAGLPIKRWISVRETVFVADGCDAGDTLITDLDTGAGAGADAGAGFDFGADEDCRRI
jgi:hypothetical protein